MRLDPATIECLVFTFKEGLLSPLAHDLAIRVDGLDVAVAMTEWHLEASCAASSLCVLGAMQGGVLRPDALADGDKRAIEAHIVDDVLHASRHREIRFTSTSAEACGDELVVRGVLDLHGERRPLVVPARRRDSAWIAEVRLHQPDFGIEPYRAMLGTLRVQADVLVRVTVEAS